MSEKEMFIPCLNRNRSKRLRKKLHVGEFQEMGFTVKLIFKPETTEDQKEAFFDKFLEECIEANNLMLGGSYEEFFLCKEKGTCTEDDRLLLVNYLRPHPELYGSDIFELVDAWYGPFSD